MGFVMKNIEAILNESADVKDFCQGYFDYLGDLAEALDAERIAQFVSELEEARKNHNTVFFIGNGGSAATASHMANDFGLGSRSENDDLPLRALALTDNAAAMTATANDCGYENLFLRQLKLHYRPGDKLVAISASGNSANIIVAAEWVRAQGGKVIGLTGFDGGRLKGIADISVHVNTPKGEYGPVEDIHMILDHLIYTWLWQKRRERARV